MDGVDETLVDEILPAGIHSVRWDAANEVSGVYYYRIEACGIADNRKLVLIK